MIDQLNPRIPPHSWKAAWVAELDQVVARDRWGIALMAIGWVHLSAFLFCEWMHTTGDLTNSHYVITWGLELLGVVAAVRIVAGRGWSRSTPMAGMITRVWATFLILAFNVASLNILSGIEREWFQPVLATLSTFAFASMAYLINTRFFIPAVQMYFTGLLMVTIPAHCYLIFGVSWWAALQGIGLVLERRRALSLRPRSYYRVALSPRIATYQIGPESVVSIRNGQNGHHSG